MVGLESRMRKVKKEEKELIDPTFSPIKKDKGEEKGVVLPDFKTGKRGGKK